MHAAHQVHKLSSQSANVELVFYHVLEAPNMRCAGLGYIRRQGINGQVLNTSMQTRCTASSCMLTAKTKHNGLALGFSHEACAVGRSRGSLCNSLGAA